MLLQSLCMGQQQAAIDRQDAKHDYEVNMKTELELLHDKINLLKEELSEIINLLREQKQQIEKIQTPLTQKQDT
jgi:uncharacterized membrane protein